MYNGVAVGQLDQAATWLLENAESTFGRSKADSGSGYHSPPPLSGVEVKAESVCICFIDDCLDCDVPLAELTFSREIILPFPVENLLNNIARISISHYYFIYVYSS